MNIEGFNFRLRNAIKSVNTTQLELADKIGISKTAMNNYAQGRIPEAKILCMIAKACNVTTDWLLTGEGEPHPSAESNLPPQLSETEEIILDTYRKADKKTRVDILKKVLDTAKSS